MCGKEDGGDVVVSGILGGPFPGIGRVEKRPRGEEVLAMHIGGIVYTGHCIAWSRDGVSIMHGG